MNKRISKMSKVVRYDDICKYSKEYYAVEKSAEMWSLNAIGYLNRKWNGTVCEKFDCEEWIDEVRNTMVFGGDDEDYIRPKELLGIFVDDDDYRHFWDCTDVCSVSTLERIWEDMVDTYNIENGFDPYDDEEEPFPIGITV